MSTKKVKNKKTNSGFKDMLYGVMLAIIVGIMPLIVRVAARPLPPELTDLFSATHPYGYPDVFSYWKAWFIAAPAIVMGFYFIADWVTSGKKLGEIKPFLLRMPIILSIIYLVFVIISAIASSYTHTAWWGTISREEGALMWLVYFVVFIAAMFYVREPKYTKPILWGLAFSSILMGAVGVSQLIERDFFNTALAERLVVANTPGIETNGFGAVFTIAYGTLFNPNTFGKYTAMVAPVLLITGIVYDGKRHTKAILVLGGALMLIGVFASSSLGGLIGIASATGVLVVAYVCGLIYRKVKNEDKKINMARVGLMFGGIMVAVVLCLLFVPPLNNRITTLFSRLQEAAAAETATQDRFAFENDTIFAYRGEERLFSMTVHTLDLVDSWMTVRDGTGQEIAPASQTLLTDTEAANYTFYIPGFRTLFVTRFLDAFALMPEGQLSSFILTLEDGQLYGISTRNLDARIDLAEPIPAWGFVGRETWGSSRGYIWSRSFPLMPSRTLIGSGPDTFINVFPHHDMAGLQLSFNNPYQIVDKAHNLFIQTWIGTGGISAIALFALFAHYLLITFWSVIKSKGETLFSYGLRLGLLAGISGFVMSSMATDSTIGSTGVFFVLLGMGYGINSHLEQQHKTADNKAQNTPE